MKTNLDNFLVCFGHSDIYGFDGGGLKRVEEEITEYNYFAILMFVCKINLILSMNDTLAPDGDIDIIKRIFPQELKKLLIAQISKNKAPNWRVFHYNSLLNLIKLALRHSPKEGAKNIESKDDFEKLINWILILNDEVGRADPGKSIVVPKDIQYGYMREYFARMQLSQENERFIYRYARFDLLLKKVMLGTKIDFRELFHLATDGIEPEEYFFFCFSLVAYWVKKNESKEYDVEKDWVINRDIYFANFIISQEKLDKLMNLLSQDETKFKQQYDEFVHDILEGEDYFLFNMFPFQQNPLILYSDRKLFTCPSLSGLYSKSTDGAYFIIEAFLRKNKMKGERYRLAETWGIVFEKYVQERLSSAFGSNLIPNPSIGGQEIADCLLKGKDVVFLFETKYAHWPYKARLTGEKKDLEIMYGRVIASENRKKPKGLEQLSEGIRKITGAYKKNKFLPVLVVGEALPVEDALNRKMIEEFAWKRGVRFDLNKSLPFIILDAEEIEILEAIAKTDGPRRAQELLIDYSLVFANKNPFGIVPESSSFKNYLHNNKMAVPNNEFLYNHFKEMVEKSLPHFLKPEGIESID